MIITGIIAITGGSGASTTTAYIARLLGMMNKKTLVVDINPRNDTAGMLSPSALPDMSEITHGEIDFKAYINASHYKNTDILSTFGNKLHVYNALDEFIGNSDFFVQLKHFAQDKYDHVLIDYSACQSKSVQAALKVCDKVVGLINAQANGVDKTIPFLEMLAQTRAGNPLDFVKILMNKVDASNLSHRLMMKQYSRILAKELKLPVAITQFKFIRKGNKIVQQLPTKAYNVMAKILNKSGEN